MNWVVDRHWSRRVLNWSFMQIWWKGTQLRKLSNVYRQVKTIWLLMFCCCLKYESRTRRQSLNMLLKSISNFFFNYWVSSLVILIFQNSKISMLNSFKILKTFSHLVWDCMAREMRSVRAVCQLLLSSFLIISTLMAFMRLRLFWVWV